MRADGSLHFYNADPRPDHPQATNVGVEEQGRYEPNLFQAIRAPERKRCAVFPINITATKATTTD